MHSHCPCKATMQGLRLPSSCLIVVGACEIKVTCVNGVHAVIADAWRGAARADIWNPGHDGSIVKDHHCCFCCCSAAPAAFVDAWTCSLLATCDLRWSWERVVRLPARTGTINRSSAPKRQLIHECIQHPAKVPGDADECEVDARSRREEF